MKLKFIHPSEQELIDTFSFYEEQLEGLGNLFLNEFNKTIKIILKHPTLWMKIGKRDAHFFGIVEQIAVNTKLAVVVTSQPPRDVYDHDTERVKEFENQIRKMEKYNIKVDVVNLPD